MRRVPSRAPRLASVLDALKTASKGRKPATAQRIADALERLAPPPPPQNDLTAADAFVWHPKTSHLAPVKRVNRVEMDLLKGIDRVRDTLVENTERFARGLPANNALLWGARALSLSLLWSAAVSSGVTQLRVAGEEGTWLRMYVRLRTHSG